MHVWSKVQSPEPKHSSLFLVVQTCKLKDVDAFIEQFNNLFYTTLRCVECLRILGENVVILVLFHCYFQGVILTPKNRVTKKGTE